jgi:DNA polymerase III sliding clamp (beta) subunit (PCNA family)
MLKRVQHDGMAISITNDPLAEDVAVAANGHRLGMVNMSVEMHISNAMAEFVLPDTVFQTCLIAATYPNYKKVIPEEFSGIICAWSKELSAALNGLEPASSRAAHNCVVLGISGEIMHLCSECNSPRIRLDYDIVCACSGKPIDQAFNAEYLRDAIRFLGCDRLSIRQVPGGALKEGARWVEMTEHMCSYPWLCRIRP